LSADISRRAPMTDEVTCCDDCPFSVARVPRYGLASFWCGHSALGDQARTSSTEHEPIPEWCPLRSGPTLVQLKVPR
jgi:hypothetical protein